MASQSSINALGKRLLQDIAEIQTKPYPNIKIHLQDDNCNKICLILDVEGYGPMHLTMDIPEDYPLEPPRVQMNSNVKHPNIYSTYICASILNTVEGYTPAYTLKGIAIQLLSFFSSDRIEQSSGGHSIALDNYRDNQLRVHDDYSCSKCNYRSKNRCASAQPSSLADFLSPESAEWLSQSDSSESAYNIANINAISSRPLTRNAKRRQAKRIRVAQSVSTLNASQDDMTLQEPISTLSSDTLQKSCPIKEANLPDEVLLMICDSLDFEELMALAQSWPRIAELIPRFDIIRTRELQCFCFKKGYMEAKLGVGVSVERKSITSEFDLLSLEGFTQYQIRRSVQGKVFEHWLPLPISYGHWRNVNAYLTRSLANIARDAGVHGSPVEVIYHFMNDIVVKLNTAAAKINQPRHRYRDFEPVQSSLTHASEKAIESYFHLFHILLCMATVQPGIVTAANRTLETFLAGKTSKEEVPNLGHLLVAALIADTPIDEKLLKSIVREAIIRNVVWMLKDRPELAYLEPSTSSPYYRLQETFRASKTSYRLFMFLNLFRRTAVGSPRSKSLVQLRDEAFARHGAPPLGSASGLARSIKRIHLIDNFPDFLNAMGIEKGGPLAFANFLRQSIKDSEKKGYSRMPISQDEAFALRRLKEPGVAKGDGISTCLAPDMDKHYRSFFPQKPRGTKTGNRVGRGPRHGY